jgi:hypothetical protein
MDDTCAPEAPTAAPGWPDAAADVDDVEADGGLEISETVASAA